MVQFHPGKVVGKPVREHMRRQVIISVLLVVALLSIGVSSAMLLIHFAPKSPLSEPTQSALLVRGLELKPQTVVEPIIGYGTAQADRHARITAQVSGELVELNPNLKVGASVEAGELLIRIDDREYQRQLDRARSLLAADEAQLKRLDVEERNLDRLIEIATTELEIGEREYQRVLGLFEAGQAPRRELDVARQGYEQARRTLQVLENSKALLPQERAAQLAMRDQHRAEVGLAELNVERCRIVAPFRGRVEAVAVEIGERVSAGTLLFAVLDPDLIEVPIELPASQADRVVAGISARLMLESNPGFAWIGRVARIAPNADRASRTFSLFVEIDNTQHEQPLMPGLFVRARIDGPTWRDVMIIPRSVIQQEQVFLFDGGFARRRPVSVDRHLLDQTVVSGLETGEVVITSNLDALYDGAPVRMQQDEMIAAQIDAADVPPAGEEGQHANPDKRDDRPTQARSEPVPGS
jgi:RND family efflux transporter MFP subunit